ncbi:hypothetical protein KKC94_03770 [Patescibacteria group bacterium]|nr:hypothetical protein [Patescibacteria group bacterium]
MNDYSKKLVALLGLIALTATACQPASNGEKNSDLLDSGTQAAQSESCDGLTVAYEAVGCPDLTPDTPGYNGLLNACSKLEANADAAGCTLVASEVRGGSCNEITVYKTDYAPTDGTTPPTDDGTTTKPTGQVILSAVEGNPIIANIQTEGNITLHEEQPADLGDFVPVTYITYYDSSDLTNVVDVKNIDPNPTPSASWHDVRLVTSGTDNDGNGLPDGYWGVGYYVTWNADMNQILSTHLAMVQVSGNGTMNRMLNVHMIDQDIYKNKRMVDATMIDGKVAVLYIDYDGTERNFHYTTIDPSPPFTETNTIVGPAATADNAEGTFTKDGFMVYKTSEDIVVRNVANPTVESYRVAASGDKFKTFDAETYVDSTTGETKLLLSYVKNSAPTEITTDTLQYNEVDSTLAYEASEVSQPNLGNIGEVRFGYVEDNGNYTHVIVAPVPNQSDVYTQGHINLHASSDAVVLAEALTPENETKSPDSTESNVDIDDWALLSRKLKVSYQSTWYNGSVGAYDTEGYINFVDEPACL